MAVIWKDEAPPRIKTRSDSSTVMLTSSSGSLRTISKNSLAGITQEPASLTSAPTCTVMPVSRLKPVSSTLVPARTRMPSRQGIVLFCATVRAASEIAPVSTAFSQVNFICFLTFSIYQKIGRIIYSCCSCSTKLCAKPHRRLRAQGLSFHSRLCILFKVIDSFLQENSRFGFAQKST